MIIEEYNSLYDANRNTRFGPAPLKEKFDLTPVERDEVIAGVEKFEQRLGQIVGRDVGQGLWFGDGYVFYGTDDHEEGSYFGGRKMSEPRGAWTVLCHSDRGGEALSADNTNRFEDAWKATLAEVIGTVFKHYSGWDHGRRSGVFFNCNPPQVNKLELTYALMREVYDITSTNESGERERRRISRARNRTHVLWRSQLYPDAWVDSISTRLNTPGAAWGFNLSIPDFVDLAFDWALSPEPLDGTPLSEVTWLWPEGTQVY